VNDTEARPHLEPPDFVAALKSLERIDPTVADETDQIYKRTVEQHQERYRMAIPFVKGKRVLDIACGTGYGSLILAEDGQAAQVVAVDVSPEAISMAKEKFAAPNIIHVHADVEKDPIPGSPFDCIVTFETIEHLMDPKGFLRSLNLMLASDGQLLASIPITQTTDINKYHLHDFSQKTAADLITSSGFRIEKTVIQPFFAGISELMSGVQSSGWEPIAPENAGLYYLKHPGKLLNRLWMFATKFGFDGSVAVFFARK
jgi:2-polyprenyl-3-methyl-5-hydroxy-6-metoxy-1,4-benzoquinol methylase